MISEFNEDAHNDPNAITLVFKHLISEITSNNTKNLTTSLRSLTDKPTLLKTILKHKNKDGCTPLLLPAKFGESDAVMAILESINSIEDTDIKKNLLTEILGHTDKDGCTPLMLAAKRGKSAAVWAILESVNSIEDIDINENLLNEILGHADKDGCTPLMLAAKHNKVNVFTEIWDYLTINEQFILTISIFNHKDKDGFTPHMLAAIHQSNAVIDALYDSHLKDDLIQDLLTALEVATNAGKLDIVNSILNSVKSIKDVSNHDSALFKKIFNWAIDKDLGTLIKSILETVDQKTRDLIFTDTGNDNQTHSSVLLNMVKQTPVMLFRNSISKTRIYKLV